MQNIVTSLWCLGQAQNLVKDQKGEMPAYSHSILNRWKSYFCQLWDVHGSSDVMQTEIHTLEPPVPEPNAFEVEMPTENLER